MCAFCHHTAPGTSQDVQRKSHWRCAALYRAASVWTAGLGCGLADGWEQPKVGAGETALTMTNALPLGLVRLPTNAFGLSPFETGARPSVGAAAIPNDIFVSGLKRVQRRVVRQPALRTDADKNERSGLVAASKLR